MWFTSKVTVEYEEDDQPTHGAWNNWECDDPSCCCHGAEEGDYTSLPNFLPSTEEALRTLRESRGR